MKIHGNIVGINFVVCSEYCMLIIVCLKCTITIILCWFTEALPLNAEGINNDVSLANSKQPDWLHMCIARYIMHVHV